jgi:hypothetical protein
MLDARTLCVFCFLPYVTAAWFSGNFTPGEKGCTKAQKAEKKALYITQLPDARVRAVKNHPDLVGAPPARQPPSAAALAGVFAGPPRTTIGSNFGRVNECGGFGS